MHLVKDIDDLDEKFNKVKETEIKVFNDTDYCPDDKDINIR